LQPTWRRSYLELTSEFDYAVGGQLEELHRALRAFHHPGKQPLAPQRHALVLLRRNQLLPTKEEARAHHVERLAAGLDEGEVARNIDLLHEAVMEDHAPEATPGGMGLGALFLRDVRHFLHFDGE